MRIRQIRLVLALAVMGMLAPATAAAATITVSTAADMVANDGQCSLREAIDAANTDTPSGTAPGECPAGTPGGNTVVLPAGDYVLSQGELDVSSPITLFGHGAANTTIDADWLSRVFSVLPGASLTVEQVTLTRGHAPDGAPSASTSPGEDGGSGGGIDNEGSLTLDHVALTRNVAGQGASPNDGHGQNAGNGGNGGAVESSGPHLTILDSTISANAAGNGGTGVVYSGSGGKGGGVDTTGGEIVITGATINANHAGDGGEFNYSGGAGGDGGGLSLAGPAPAMLANDTIAGNHGGIPGNPFPAAASDGGALVQFGGTVQMTQVTVAGNTEGDEFNCCHNISTTGEMMIADSALDASCSPRVTDGGYDVSLSGGGCPGIQVGQLGSPAFDLGALQDNGGAAETMLPQLGSALIDEVPTTGAGCEPTDQRGVSRPQGTACDAGSVERRVAQVQSYPSRRRFGWVRLRHVHRRRVTLVYTGGDGALDFGGARVTGHNRGSFRIVHNGCRYAELQLGESCDLVISFRPRRPTRLKARLSVTIQLQDQLVTIPLIGRGFF